MFTGFLPQGVTKKQHGKDPKQAKDCSASSRTPVAQWAEQQVWSLIYVNCSRAVIDLEVINFLKDRGNNLKTLKSLSSVTEVNVIAVWGYSFTTGTVPIKKKICGLLQKYPVIALSNMLHHEFSTWSVWQSSDWNIKRGLRQMRRSGFAFSNCQVLGMGYLRQFYPGRRQGERMMLSLPWRIRCCISLSGEGRPLQYWVIKGTMNTDKS